MIDDVDDCCPSCGCPNACAEGTYEAMLANAQRLADKVRALRLMLDAAGLHRTAEDMDDVLDQHDALVSKAEAALNATGDAAAYWQVR